MTLPACTLLQRSPLAPVQVSRLSRACAVQPERSKLALPAKLTSAPRGLGRIRGSGSWRWEVRFGVVGLSGELGIQKTWPLRPQTTVWGSGWDTTPKMFNGSCSTRPVRKALPPQPPEEVLGLVETTERACAHLAFCTRFKLHLTHKARPSGISHSHRTLTQPCCRGCRVLSQSSARLHSGSAVPTHHLCLEESGGKFSRKGYKKVSS